MLLSDDIGHIEMLESSMIPLDESSYIRHWRWCEGLFFLEDTHDFSEALYSDHADITDHRRLACIDLWEKQVFFPEFFGGECCTECSGYSAYLSIESTLS